MTQSALKTFLEETKPHRAERSLQALDDYIELIEHFNSSMNLVGQLDRQSIFDQLILDSLAPIAHREPRGSALDVGSGAGLPGIPLSILYPEVEVTLVEPRRKRATFLKIATHRLGLENTEIVPKRIENTNFSQQFDYVVAKALCPPSDWLHIAAPLVDTEGVVISLTRPDQKSELQTTARQFDLELLDTEPEPDLNRSDRAVFMFRRAH